jgi:putative salt-induced outer membrane protein YdiY
LYFKVFDLKCFILNTKDNLDKFDPKSNVDIFLGYSSSNKAYKVYNNRILCLEESIHVAFEESQNDKIIEILDDINESVQYLSLNNKTHMGVNNEEMNKDQPSTSN